MYCLVWTDGIGAVNVRVFLSEEDRLIAISKDNLTPPSGAFGGWEKFDVVAEGIKREEWRDIASAPRDGTRVLLCADRDGTENLPESRRVHTGYWNPEGSAWVDECGSFDGSADHLENTGSWLSGSGWFQPNEVTHWRQLPEPPAVAAQEQGDSDE